ncbi:MAG: hypothetical protein Kow0037_25410 [Calditrichia bacterium]
MGNWLAIYDIRDEKRLHRIAKQMENYGIRVQKSVFEIQAGRATINELREKVKGLMKPEDFVVYFAICEKDWQKIERYGCKEYDENWDKNYYIY